MPALDTRQRIALRLLGDDWTATGDLVGRSAFYGTRHAIAGVMGRYAVAGLVERRGPEGRYEWRLTDAGRAAR